MDEAWEALDVDDSDLPSLLRPCSNSRSKFHHHNTISLSSQTLIPSSTTTVPPPSPPSPPRLIPGPAGRIQAAMIRKRHHDSISEESPIPTQEFIRRETEDSEQSYLDDDDFKSIAWIRAVEFLSTSHNCSLFAAEVVLPATPLSSVDNKLPDRKVNQVVAIVNSCTPNGLGDLMVKLKDPTGTIDGTIHRKVLLESEFAQDIAVKAAVVLKKVSVFAASPKLVHLNITLGNVVKVFNKDIAPLSRETRLAPKVTYVLPPVNSGKSTTLQDTSLQEQESIDKTVQEARQVATTGRSWHVNSQKRAGVPFSRSDNCNYTSIRDKTAGTQKQALRDGQCGAVAEIYEEATGMDIAVGNQATIDGNEKLPKYDNLSEGHQSGGYMANSNGNHANVQKADKAVKERAMSKASLPEWTDEQLLELFDDDPLL